MLEWASSHRRRLGVWFQNRTLGTLALALSVTFMVNPDQAGAQSEDQVKAAFLFNFVRYVEWPDEVFADEAAEVKICMLRADSFLTVVKQTVSGKRVGERRVRVDSIETSDPVRNCHLLYVGALGQKSVSTFVSELGNAPVFTVSDSEGFAESGGMANFFRTESKIRFEMNPDAARKAKLKISSRLLRLARVVK